MEPTFNSETIVWTGRNVIHWILDFLFCIQRIKIVSVIGIPHDDRNSVNKQLRGVVYFVDKLPMTASGKIQKRFVQAMAIEMNENVHVFIFNNQSINEIGSLNFSIW